MQSDGMAIVTAMTAERMPPDHPDSSDQDRDDKNDQRHFSPSQTRRLRVDLVL